MRKTNQSGQLLPLKKRLSKRQLDRRVEKILRRAEKWVKVG